MDDHHAGARSGNSRNFPKPPTWKIWSSEVDGYNESRRDLNEAMRIAKRGGMRLYECDTHLEYARLALVERKPDDALPHFKSAEALVSACGYHRRDPEIAALKEELGL